MRPYRELIKHSAVYGVGQILSRLASVLLLPLYTYALSPADYGRVAILDLTTGILAILIGSEMASALCCHHFDAEDERARDAVWWTGLTFVAAIATAVVVPLWLARGQLARLTLDSPVEEGGRYYALALATLWLNTTGHLLETYTRVRKWSGLFVAISMARLLLNVGLNAYLLAFLQAGIPGLLLGNLVASGFFTAALLAVFAASRGRYRFDPRLVAGLVRFAAPLVAIALLSLLMHEADRYLLRTMVDMEEVGTYSLAYKVGQALNTLILLPFGAIWGVVVYEVGAQPQARSVYATVFRCFTFGLLVIMLGAALAAGPVLALLTPDAYRGAIELVPVILLAYVFFNLHGQFSVPALLAKRTGVLVPGSVAGVVVNLAANLVLIPRFGAAGAAWASVASYAVFSLVTLAFCRRIDRLPYPFADCLGALAGVCLTFVALRAMCAEWLESPAMLPVAAAAAGLWAVVLFAPLARRLMRRSAVAKPAAEGQMT